MPDLHSLSTAETRALIRLLMAAMFVDGEAHPAEKKLFDGLLRQAAIPSGDFDSAKSMTLDRAIEVYRQSPPASAQIIRSALRQMVKADGVLTQEEARLEQILGMAD